MKNPINFAGRYALSFFLVTSLCVVAFSTTVFAQGNAVCKGDVGGVLTNPNTNIGKTSFNAHDKQILTVDDYVNLGIVGGGQGLAPGNLGDAACTEFVRGNYGNVAYDHRLKGWAWNENLGFVSFSCEAGKNKSGAANGGASCGNIDYGVYLANPLPNGDRMMRGYAWNPVFGWMQFDNQQFPAYAGKVDANGFVSGYAWTSVGLWVNLSGMRVEVFADEAAYFADDGPDNDPEFDVFRDDQENQPIGWDFNDADLPAGGGGGGVPVNEWCDGKPFFCAEVDPAPSALDMSFDAEADDSVKIADGVDGYYIHLYFRDAEGDGPMANGFRFDAFKNSLRFFWDDTVKADQVRGDSAADRFDLMNRPWTQSQGKAAVRFKPLTLAADFREDPVGSGHYVSIEPVTSYAPTSGNNVSFTNTEPPYPFDNETFVNDVGVPALVEPNELILRRIEHGALLSAAGVQVMPAGPIFPNGKADGEKFKFRPAVEVRTLYSGSRDDSISAFRGIPLNIRMGLGVYGDLNRTQLNSALINFALDYAASEQEIIQEQRCGQANFLFSFLTNIVGRDVSAESLSSLVAGVADFGGRQVDVQAMATLPVVEVAEGEEAPLPCYYAEAPSLYSWINYFPDNLGSVKYYSNKLPKTIGDIQNPSIVVHGNIYGQEIGNVNENKSQLVGNPAINVVRDTISKSFEKYGVTTLAQPANEGTCEVSFLRTVEASKYTVRGAQCRKDLNYRAFTIGDENVLYFKGRDVVLNFPTGSTQNRWVVIADGGNIFINSEIDNADDNDKRIVLVALRDTGNKYFRTGHAYIAGGKSMVVDATMVLDGSLFSYSGELPPSLDPVTGVPLWENAAERSQALNYQLLLRGSIYSDNTIGGADLDGGDDPKEYLLAGAGEIIELPADTEDRLRAQAYDLNYLRLFTLRLQTCDDGTPMDQVCGKCLSTEDIFAIAEGAQICGEKGEGACNPNARPGVEQAFACNGINPFEAYDPSSGFSEGDLVPPPGIQLVVEEGYDPVYVYYRAPTKDSFVFKN